MPLKNVPLRTLSFTNTARAGFGAARARNLAVRVAAPQGLDLEEAIRGVVDLQRRVVDPEPLVERELERAADPVAVLAAADEHVRREGREAGADLPDMEVVDAVDARMLEDRLGDVPGREPFRGRFEQDPPGDAQERPGGEEHRARDEQRRDRVCAVEARRPDDETGNRRAGERVEVGQQVAEAAFDVQVGAVGAGDLQEGEHVDRGAGERGPENQRAVDVRGRAEPAERLDDDRRSEQEQRRAVRLRGEDLRPAEAERHPATGRAKREPSGPDAHSERRRVDQHVCGVREQRDRVRDHAEHDLDGHEADDQPERDRERPDDRFGADPVVMVMVVRHAFSLTGMDVDLTESRGSGRDGVVFVEIPSGSRNKYEWDDELGGLALDRRLFTSMSYPADYGFIEGTLAEDGDPLDALVLVGEPTFPGCRIRVRAVGVFHMTDEKGPDEKVLCVPLNDPSWSGIADIHDVPAQLRNEIEHFFQVYKDLEKKTTETRGYGNRSDAQAIIAACRARLSAAAR